MATDPWPDEALSPPGPYDEDPEEPPWFAPDPAPAFAAPLPRAPQRVEAGEADWDAAVAGAAGAMASAALALGALDERVRQGGAGLRRRLLVAEVAGLSWHLGDRIGPDRLGLYLALRLSTSRDDAQGLARAAWAHRRLAEAALPAPAPVPLADWLGRLPGGAAEVDRPVGIEFDRLAATFARRCEAAAGLPALARGARAWADWRALSLSDGPAALEGAVFAALAAGQGLRPAGLGFVPLALADGTALSTGGPAVAILAAWCAGVERCALRGLLEADRVEAWATAAERACADLSGRTPARLIAALSAWPLASAPMLQADTGASRAAVQRNLDRLAARGLVREVTGHSRYRFWAAALGG